VTRAERKRFFDLCVGRMLRTTVVMSHDHKRVKLEAVVDTGAPISVIAVGTAKALGFHPPKTRQSVLRTPGENVLVYGGVPVSVKAVRGPKVPIWVVVSGPTFLRSIEADMLLGLDYLASACAHVDVLRKTVSYEVLPMFTGKAHKRKGLNHVT